MPRVHRSKAISLTSADVLEDAAERGAVFCGARTVVVTLHTDERPKGLPRGTKHVAAAFDDSHRFDDDAMARQLDRMVAAVDAAGAPRVVFVCHAGVNRSSLALCYYCAKAGGCGWLQAKAAIVGAKGVAARGWPTLENAAFERFLARRFDGASAPSSEGRPQKRGIGRAQPEGGRCKAKKPRVAREPKARMTKRQKIRAGLLRCPSRSCGRLSRCRVCGRAGKRRS